MTNQLPGLNLKSENVPSAYHWMLVSMYPTYVWFLALNFVLLFELQVGQRCTLGWSTFGTLFSWVCHRIWLPVRVLEQGPAGALHPGDWQCVTPHVWEVLRPRLGVPVPAQPPAHQLCCSAHRKPGLHDPRLVNKDSIFIMCSCFWSCGDEENVGQYLCLALWSRARHLYSLWLSCQLIRYSWLSSFKLQYPALHNVCSSRERPSEIKKPAIQLALLRIGIWFLVQKIQSWCEWDGSWPTDNQCSHSGFI